MHQDTDIYAAVEKLGDFALGAVAQMRRSVKPVLGPLLIKETVYMAVLVKRAAIARGTDKVPIYEELRESEEVVQYLLKRAFNNRFLPMSQYALAMPLVESVGKQATALRKKFATAT